MQRYFFDIENGDGFTSDEEGKELAQDSEIAGEIARIVMDIATDEVSGSSDVQIKVSVRDTTGAPIVVSIMTFTMHWMRP